MVRVSERAGIWAHRPVPYLFRTQGYYQCQSRSDLRPFVPLCWAWYQRIRSARKVQTVEQAERAALTEQGVGRGLAELQEQAAPVVQEPVEQVADRPAPVAELAERAPQVHRGPTACWPRGC